MGLAAPTAAPAAPAVAFAAYVTPIVRKLACDKGVDLTAVSGTGVGGRIRKEDVQKAAAAAEEARRAAEARAAEASAFYRKRRYRRGYSEGSFMKVLKVLLFGAAAAGIAWGVWYG